MLSSLYREDFFMKNILLAILFATATPAMATTLEIDRDASSLQKNYFGPGGTLGATTGIGLSFKHHTPYYGLGYQLTLGGFGTPTDFLAASAGFQVMLTFASMKHARVYGLAGTGVFFSRTHQASEQYCEWDEVLEVEENCETIPDTFVHGMLTNFGVGLGIEFILWDTIGLAFDLPLSTSISVGDASGLQLVGLFPIPNLSLIYYF